MSQMKKYIYQSQLKMIAPPLLNATLPYKNAS